MPEQLDSVPLTNVEERPLQRELADLVAAQYGRLIRLAGLICDRTSDGEDAVQAALEQAWRRRATLRDADRLSSWLDRIVVREAIRLNRRRRGFLSRFFPPAHVRELSTGPDEREPAAHSLEPVSRAAIRIAYDALPAAQRAVVALHLYAGYSVAETAGLLHIPLETARSRLRLARARLREGLSEDER
jgi:RNA polymerase sigma-70 factor (ECF subfamily)